jgi:RHS repeat-associated protein
LLFCFYLAKHPGRNTFRPGRVVGTKNRRDDYCGQGLLVLLARQKNTPGRAWQRVLFNCPYGHRKNQTYIAAKHPEHFYVKDNLGSTRAVVDEAGDVVEAYDYYPLRRPRFGGTKAGLQSRSYKEKGDPLTKETFTGKEQDIESNLHYFGARYYDAGAGRWLSVDPLAGTYFSLSPYVSAANNPVEYIDPDGKKVVMPTIASMKQPDRQRQAYVEYRDRLKRAIVNLYEQSGTFRKVYNSLYGAEQVFELYVVPFSDERTNAIPGLQGNNAVSEITTIEIDGEKELIRGKSYFRSSRDDGALEYDIAHELVHLYEYLENIMHTPLGEGSHSCFNSTYELAAKIMNEIEAGNQTITLTEEEREQLFKIPYGDPNQNNDSTHTPMRVKVGLLDNLLSD